MKKGKGKQRTREEGSLRGAVINKVELFRAKCTEDPLNEASYTRGALRESLQRGTSPRCSTKVKVFERLNFRPLSHAHHLPIINDGRSVFGFEGTRGYSELQGCQSFRIFYAPRISLVSRTVNAC